MATLYGSASISPTKQELLESWVPTRLWGTGVAGFRRIGSYRFDDPAGEVGIETHLLQAGNQIFQVPLTYRPALLDNSEATLVTTMEHSVLGRRWIYDACTDPVYVTALLSVMLDGASQAEEWIITDHGAEQGDPQVRVLGSNVRSDVHRELGAGAPVDSTESTIISDRLVVRRVLTEQGLDVDGPKLTGTWPGQETPQILAFAR